MSDAAIHKPLRVSYEGSGVPYLVLPESRLAEVRRFLDGRGIRYWVEEEVISMDGGPEEAWINFDRGADAPAIQAILDDVG
jgi:hypothetical protein